MSEPWTPLDELKRVAVTRLDGTRIEFDVEAAITDGHGQPLWFMHRDVEGREVIQPWITIASLTILERHPEPPCTSTHDFDGVTVCCVLPTKHDGRHLDGPEDKPDTHWWMPR